jgi:outer membrane receptor protein involved in Fe transport
MKLFNFNCFDFYMLTNLKKNTHSSYCAFVIVVVCQVAGLISPLCAQITPADSGVNGLAKKLIVLEGHVLDATGEALPGVVVRVVGHQIGAETDLTGDFKLKIPADQALKLHVTYATYEEQIIDLQPNQTRVVIKLTPEVTLGTEIVVSASRVHERSLESPVSIERIDALAIRETPALNAYDALAQTKGVDIIASSLTFKTINARGFNGPGNTRFIQRIDGMDTQVPGLNMSLGSLNGSSDLDIANIELIPGAASALYGPNALNGLLNIQTKSPFDYPGLSVSMRAAANNFENGQAKPFGEMNLRYAGVLKNKRLGYKLNAGYLRGTDWPAQDPTDIANYTGTVNLRGTPPGIGNPGYDGLNIYGDEVSAIFDSTIFTQAQRNLIRSTTGRNVEPVRIARSGYRERDLVNYDLYTVKGDASVHYKLTEHAEVSVMGRVSRGRSVWMADNRIMLDGFTTYNAKAELKGKNYFLRAYTMGNDAGSAYDSRFAAMNLNKLTKSDTSWFGQYQAIYFGLYNQFAPIVGEPLLPAFSDSAARAFANQDNTRLIPKLEALANALPAELRADILRFSDILRGGARLEPGTPKFDSLLAVIKNNRDFNRGARFTDRSQFYHVEGQYDFSDHFKPVEIIAGGSYRSFVINSEGRVFSDTLGPIHVPEYGGYVQLTKRFFDKRLRISASGRIDKTARFDAQLSPRLATVLSLGQYRQHNFRASVQSAFKMPDLRHRYINFNVGTFQIIGGFEDTYRAYGLLYRDAEGQLRNNAYTLESVERMAALRDSTGVLVPYRLKAIQPEYVRTFEVGYKGLLSRKLMLDLAWYVSRYTNFIGMVAFAGPRIHDANSVNVPVTVNDVVYRDGAGNEQFQRYRHYANAENPITTQGFAASVQYLLNSKWTLLTNYTYSDILAQEASGFQAEFNTPRHKTNVTLTARDLIGKFGLALNYRWNESYLFQYSFANGIIPENHCLDAQVSWHLAKYNSIVKVGGTNLLGVNRVQVVGGPVIGPMLYVQVTYDSFLN